MIVRGLRAVSDFEFEFQMALMNQRLKPKIETVFMMPAEQYTYISSRLIKEVFALGGRVHGWCRDLVEERLQRERARRKNAMKLADRTSRIAGSPTMKVAADGRSPAALGHRGDRFRRRRAGFLDARRDQGRGARRRSTPTSRATRRSPASPI